MKPNDLFLRCYAEKKGDQWQVFCIDLCLAAQGDSLKEVKGKLHLQIGEYVYDALVGEDAEYSRPLLTRKSPLSQRLKYHLYSATGIAYYKEEMFARFFETMPVTPFRHRSPP